MHACASMRGDVHTRAKPLSGTPSNDYLPQPHPFGCHEARRAAAKPRARLWGRSAPRRRPKGGEERRVPTPRFVEQRGGSSGERGIRTLGRLLTYVRLASGYLRPLGHLSRRSSEAREGENVAASGLGSSGIATGGFFSDLFHDSSVFSGGSMHGSCPNRWEALGSAACRSAVPMCRGPR